MKHFINLKDIPAKDLRKIITDAKKRKSLRKKLSTLEVDQGSPLKGKLLIQMFEKSSLRTRLSFYLAIKQLGGGTLTLRSNELHSGQGGESIADTAKILSKYFLLKLNKIREKHPNIIKQIRGKGFLIGIQLYKDQTEFIKKLMNNQLLTIRAAENVVRILPPLNVKIKEIDLALKIINKVCSEIK